MKKTVKIFLIVLGSSIMTYHPETLANTLQSTLEKQLDKVKKDLNLVGIGGIVLKGGQIKAISVNGVRKKGSHIKLSIDNKWHIGSITKTVTALLIAHLAEQKKLSFDDKITKFFPEIKSKLHPDWDGATLEKLLTFRAGVKENFSTWTLLMGEKFESDAAMNKQRHKLIEQLLISKPTITPGTKYSYSNAGYTLAGVIAEKVEGKPWETLVKEEIFKSLQLKSAGFRAPIGKEKLSEPWGHWSLMGFKTAQQPGTQGSDITPTIGPAGNIHMSLSDLAKYGYEHLKGRKGKSTLLSKEGFHILHKGYAMEGYPDHLKMAMAWGVEENSKNFGNQLALWSNGSNLMWYASLYLFPEKDTVIAVVSNDGTSIEKTQPAFMLIANKMLSLID